MSLTIGTPSPTEAVSPLVSPIIEAFAEGLKPSVALLMIGTVLASMLVPLLIAVVYFSTSKTRRQSIYRLVVLSILLGLTLGCWNGVMEVRAILTPLRAQSNQEFFAFMIIFSLTPWVVDFVLLFRLFAVFNRNQTRLSILAAVLAFPVAIKILRLSLLVTFAVQWHKAVDNIGDAVIAAEGTWRSSVCPKIEWISQILDHGFCSAMFMYRLRGSMKLSPLSGPRRDTVARRIQTLFWIAATNFIFPIIYNFIQIILLLTNASFFPGAYLLMINTYLSIFGVVFATIWSSAMNHKGDSDGHSTLVRSDGTADRNAAKYISHIRQDTGALSTGAMDSVTWVQETSNVPMKIFINRTVSEE